MNDATADSTSILPRRKVLYCGKCGMPPEYCEYGPDYETHCDKWLQAHHPELRAILWERRKDKKAPAVSATKPNSESDTAAAARKPRPDAPWTTEQRLSEFYKKYAPEKMDGISEILVKYAGKEDKLFMALVKKYGDEPKDPYYSDSDDELDSEDDASDDDDEPATKEGDEAVSALDAATKKARRGAGVKKVNKTALKVIVQKIAQKKKKNLTIVKGLEHVEGHKLKDISKAFSKRFAGSSSVKEDAAGNKEIILQGDHMYDVAEMIIDKFGVPESSVFLDLEGDIVPFK
ncbi:hypothetical protein MPSEU_000274200 [Mayamaea pseudoterrestris]|nr:hypothetical protein MPSEU_000274200 [Mayamaea pseudoterrestris]